MALMLKHFGILDKMVLVDTTIWVEFMKANPTFVKDMESLLEGMKVIAIEPVFAELLFGARNEKEKRIILSYWKVLPKIPFTEGSLIDSAGFGNKRNYHNLGVGLIDSVLIRATIENHFKIWTLDRKILNALEKQFFYA